MARAKTIVRQPEATTETPVTRHVIFREIRAGASRAEILARDSVYLRRWEYRNAMEHFPNDPYSRYVEKYFPYADGGPLLVDEPTTPHQVERCQRKAVVLREMGYRYLVLTPEMTEADERKALSECGP